MRKFNLLCSFFTNTRLAQGVATFAMLAIFAIPAINSAQAAQGDQSQAALSGFSGSAMLLAANDTKQAVNKATTSKSTKVEKNTGLSSKGTEAKLQAGPTPSEFWIVNTLRAHPELVIFLTLAIGYLIGGFKFGSFSLGAVTGTLLVGVLIGQLEIAISPQVKSIFFVMFLFAVGYSVGPQFVRGVAKDGAPQAIFAVVISVLCLLCTFLAAKAAGFDVGLAAGMYAGAQTISASIGLATNALNSSGISNAPEMLNQMPVAYAITYLFGTIGTGMILSMLGPKLLRINLEEECKKYEAELSKGQPEGGMNTAWHQLQMRTFEISADAKAASKTVAEVEALRPEARMYIERIRHDGTIIDFDSTTTIHAGDVIAISGPTESLIALEQQAREVPDQELLDVPVESVDLVVTNKKLNGETLIDLAKKDFARGVYLQSITRSAVSVEVPILAQTKIYRGDILKISGTSAHIDRIAKSIGYADRPSNMTDMVWVGLFIIVFGLIGTLTMDIGGVPLTLSSSGGVLIGGLILGWARGVHPTFGRLPAATQWFMNSVGLNVFIAIVGITAGPSFVAGLKANGGPLLLWGIVATSVPMLLAPLIGKYIFKFHPAINLGVCGGARTSTASVAMVSDVAKSNIPMLGYTVPYAVSNTLLTLFGMVMVLMY